MAEENNERGMSRRKVLGGIATAGTAAAVGAGGTWAYLSDEGSSEFSFTTGDLEVDVTPDTLNFDPINEGEKTATVDIENNGSLPVRQLYWNVLNVNGETAVAKAMEIISVKYGKTDITGDVESQVSGGSTAYLQDIADYLQNNEIVLDSVSTEDDKVLPSGTSRKLIVTVKVDYSKPGMTEDNMSMSATVNVMGMQKPTGSSSSASTPAATTTSSGN